MAAEKIMPVLQIILFLVLLAVCICIGFGPPVKSTLNTPRLLLPQRSQQAVRYSLHVRDVGVADGCFIWQSSRPEVASVQAVDVDDKPVQCSVSAVVTVESHVPSRKTTIITAEDIVRSEQLRCDVIVDLPTEFEIDTTTRELYLDDSPEEFIIRAKSDKGDVFSSIEGLTFDVDLVSESLSSNDVSAHSVLRLLKFSESSYEAPVHIKQLEEQGRHGDRILLQGIHTGTAIVAVRAIDSAFKHLPEARVRIVVVANLQLSPALAYILQHSSVQFKVDLLKQGRAHPITMPSQQYRLELSNETVGSLDQRTSTVTGLEIGSTELQLKGLSNVKLSESFREPSAGIYVVTPAYLEFTVLPGRNWMLVTGRVYVIYVDIYDKESHKIFPSPNLRTKTYFAPEYFRVHFSSVNGTYHIVETLLRGQTTLHGELKTVITASGSEKTFSPSVQGSQLVEILDPVLLLPHVVALPWDPNGKTVSYQYKATGGSGNYSWTSSNTSAAVVDMHGIVTSLGVIGRTNVTASDIRSSAYYDVSEVLIIPPIRMEFLPSRVEAELDTSLFLPLAMYGTTSSEGPEIAFQVCHMLSMNVKVTDDAIFRDISVRPSEVDGACAEIVLKAANIGHIDLVIQYDSGVVRLSAAITVAAYPPLKPFDPTEIAVVTIGSSREMLFEGGPRPWILDPSKYTQSVTVEQANVARISAVSYVNTNRNRHVFRAHCSDLGEQKLSLTVGNEPTAKNTLPATAVASVRFACETPKRLSLVPVVVHPDGVPPCPVSPELDDPVPIPLIESVVMMTVLTDRLGRKFDNFSSVLIDWTLSNPLIGDLSSVPVKPNQLFRQEKVIKLKGEASQLGVTASISQYDPTVHHGTISPPLSKSRTLDIVTFPSFSVNELTLYNHAQSKCCTYEDNGEYNAALQGSIEIVNGSGYFLVSNEPSEQNVADFKRNQNERNISVYPRSEGTSQLSVTDLCLGPVQIDVASIIVADVAHITLVIVDKVELHNELEGRVQVLDSKREPLRREYFSLMKLKLVAGSDIISIRPKADHSGGDDVTAVYIIHGSTLGKTDLHATAITKSGHEILSRPQKIEVFPPLKLDPKEIVLIPGARLQVMAFGGPHESTIKFDIDNEVLASADRNGVIEALSLGRTTVMGRAVGPDGVIYSSDSSNIRVVELTGVRIETPLKRIVSGTKMPLYVVGAGDQVTPFSFSGITPPLLFYWSVSNKQVATVQPVFQQSGLDTPDSSHFAMRFHAEGPGHVTVTLNVTMSHRGSVISLTDSITVQVFQRLQFKSPPITDGVLLMTPKTDMHVQTNRDGSSASMTYTVLDVPEHSKRAGGGLGPGPWLSELLPSSVIRVSGSGIVSSDLRTGQASLEVSAVEEFGVNQSMVILVKVKPLSFVMITPLTIVYTRSGGTRLSAFPTRTAIEFIVTFHDDIGDMFHATRHNVAYRPDKYDLLQVTNGLANNTIVARATNSGSTTLKVWDKISPSIVDYVSIPVDYAIYPTDLQVTLGSVICFTSLLVSVEGNNGVWFDASSSLLVDGRSGITLVDHVGTSTIGYNATSSATLADVSVLPITKVQLNANDVRFVTNWRHVELGPSAVSINLENVGSRLLAGFKGTNCSEVSRAVSYSVVRFPYHCHISFTFSHRYLSVHDIIKVRPSFDVLSGHYQCLMTLNSSVDLIPVLAPFDTVVKLWAVVSQIEGQPELISDSINIPFIPAFHIINSEIWLSRKRQSAEIKMLTIERLQKDMQLVSDNDKWVRVHTTPTNRGAQHSDGVAHYPVDLIVSLSLLGMQPFDVTIEIKCVRTGQTAKVIVHVIMDDEEEVSWTQLVTMILYSYQSLYPWIIGFGAVVVSYFMYHLLVTPPDRGPPSGVFLTPGARMQQPICAPQVTPPASHELWSVDRSPYRPQQLSPLNRSLHR